MATNLAAEYGVKIEPSLVTGPCWRAVLVRHLTPNENRGQHNLFVDVVDDTGARVLDDRLRIAWFDYPGDLTADYARLDKPDTTIEKGDGNIPISLSQTIQAWIHGDGLPSDRVTGIHTRHDDEPGPNGENWNSVGHHSFYVRFQLTLAGGQPTEPPADTAEKRLAALEARQAASEAWQKTVERHLQQMLGEL